jgi:hypothetical protein
MGRWSVDLRLREQWTYGFSGSCHTPLEKSEENACSSPNTNPLFQEGKAAVVYCTYCVPGGTRTISIIHVTSESMGVLAPGNRCCTFYFKDREPEPREVR